MLTDSRTVLSKLPDYLCAGRPVLALTAPTSALGRLFDGDGAGLTAHYASHEQVADRLRTVFESWQERQLDRFLPSRLAVESFSDERALAELAAAFATAREASGPTAEA